MRLFLIVLLCFRRSQENNGAFDLVATNSCNSCCVIVGSLISFSLGCTLDNLSTFHHFYVYFTCSSTAFFFKSSLLVIGKLFVFIKHSSIHKRWICESLDIIERFQSFGYIFCVFTHRIIFSNSCSAKELRNSKICIRKRKSKTWARALSWRDRF